MTAAHLALVEHGVAQGEGLHDEVQLVCRGHAERLLSRLRAVAQQRHLVALQLTRRHPEALQPPRLLHRHLMPEPAPNSVSALSTALLQATYPSCFVLRACASSHA